MAYLDDHPPARSQFRFPRRAEPSGVVVVHTAENAPDYTGSDGAAEAVAKFIQGRDDPGSYHDLVDSDSDIQLVRYDAEAFHDATGSNPHSYGVSIATRADLWPSAPVQWRQNAVYNAAACAARYAHWLHARSGIIIPPRRISRDESELRMPGFISHAERDPARRTDPGPHFPWADFLAVYARLTADLGAGPAVPIPTPYPEDVMPFPVVAAKNDSHGPWTALLPGKVIRFVNGDLPPETVTEAWAPAWAYDAGVKTGFFKPYVRLDSDTEYDQAVAVAQQYSRLPSAAHCDVDEQAIADAVVEALPPINQPAELRVVLEGTATPTAADG